MYKIINDTHISLSHLSVSMDEVLAAIESTNNKLRLYQGDVP